MKEAIRSGRLHCTQITNADRETGAGLGLLTAAQSQVVVPVSRESNVLGLLLLESVSEIGFSEENCGVSLPFERSRCNCRF